MSQVHDNNEVPAPCGDARCMCGSLLARLTKTGVEIKCRRCRRTITVPFDQVDSGEETGRPADAP